MPQTETAQKILIENLNGLMRARKMKVPELAELSGVSLRMVRFVLKSERMPTIETINRLASAFQLSSWQLLMPNFHKQVDDGAALNAVLASYIDSDSKGRELIKSVAEREAEYNRRKPN